MVKAKRDIAANERWEESLPVPRPFLAKRIARTFVYARVACFIWFVASVYWIQSGLAEFALIPDNNALYQRMLTTAVGPVAVVIYL